MTLYEKVQALCENAGFAISNLSEEIPGLKLTRGTISGWKKGAKPRADTLKAIADHFGVDVGYLTCENHTELQTPHGSPGTSHGPGGPRSGTEWNLSDQEIGLLHIFSQLDIADKARLIVYADELRGKE